MEVQQKVGKECRSCGKLTKYICIDCLIDEKGFIPICREASCIRDHESKDCARIELNADQNR